MTDHRDTAKAGSRSARETQMLARIGEVVVEQYGKNRGVIEFYTGHLQCVVCSGDNYAGHDDDCPLIEYLEDSDDR